MGYRKLDERDIAYLKKVTAQERDGLREAGGGEGN